MNVVRDKNGQVCVNAQCEPSPENLKDMERLPDVVEEVSELVFRETPTVAVSALVSVLSRVLLVAGGDPMNEARIVGDALRAFVRENLRALG